MTLAKYKKDNNYHLSSWHGSDFLARTLLTVTTQDQGVEGSTHIHVYVCMYTPTLKYSAKGKISALAPVPGIFPCFNFYLRCHQFFFFFFFE